METQRKKTPKKVRPAQKHFQVQSITQVRNPSERGVQVLKGNGKGGGQNPKGRPSTPPPQPCAHRPGHKAKADLMGKEQHLWALAYRDRPLDSPHHGGSCPTLHGLLGCWGLLALGLPLLPLAVPLHEGALHLGNDIRVSLGVLNALPNRERKGEEPSRPNCLGAKPDLHQKLGKVTEIAWP